MLEKVIFDRKLDVFADNIMSSSQFGFMKKRSTLQQLLIFISYIFQSFNDRVQVDTTYWDKQKSFWCGLPQYRLGCMVSNAWKFLKHIPEWLPTVCINQQSQFWGSSSNIWSASGQHLGAYAVCCLHQQFTQSSSVCHLPMLPNVTKENLHILMVLFSKKSYVIFQTGATQDIS